MLRQLHILWWSRSICRLGNGLAISNGGAAIQGILCLRGASDGSVSNWWSRGVVITIVQTHHWSRMQLLPTAAEPGQATAKQKDATTNQDDSDSGAQRWFHGTTLEPDQASEHKPTIPGGP